jgi:hypothetical protein
VGDTVDALFAFAALGYVVLWKLYAPALPKWLGFF